MYILLGIDTVVRIVAAMAFLFAGVPMLMRARPRELGRMEWFWWCLGCGITLLTICGQILTLLNAYSAATLLLLIALAILFVRARVSQQSPVTLLHDSYRKLVLASLNILEGRVNVRRRILRAWHRRPRVVRASGAPWFLLIAIAAAFRLYRPFATANLGFSDTYVHLYLMRLLEQGKQVDPAWGPYPRGMHFLLMAIHELTNADMILLMNFFGAIVGVLMTIAVADTARRLSRNTIAGLLAGLVFATMAGGARQYFLLGGSVATDNAEEARSVLAMPYRMLPETAEVDILGTVFQRQTATLPQELALVLLFPAVMFLFGKSRWHLAGYFFCTAAIAATHPGVVIPLVLLSATAIPWIDVKRAIAAGALGILAGSTWMLGYLAYPMMGTSADASGAQSGAAYYFPFLRSGDVARIVTWVPVTPFLVACVVIALAFFMKQKWIALTVCLFALTHVASRFGLPEIVEVRRNASWFAMAIAILLGVVCAELARTRAWKPVVSVLFVLWLTRVPLAGANERLINYSGFSGTAQAVLEIQRKLEPFTWTLVTYGQEFPMVLGKGFHIAAAEFLERYDPEARKLAIPTRYVFLAVEKTPHRFQINSWAAKFSRADLEQRLQTWCFLYQLRHRDMHIFRDDEHVRVYVIDRL
ncbi:MAG TPA: hypothetical protein VKB93_08525 [Thermoanaerobaculia bacterium]|nr:hypothetical protein [Thermoanaerobaculia bacterium]